jgi:hypothetical protein
MTWVPDRGALRRLVQSANHGGVRPNQDIRLVLERLTYDCIDAVTLGAIWSDD